MTEPAAGPGLDRHVATWRAGPFFVHDQCLFFISKISTPTSEISRYQTCPMNIKFKHDMS
jgi:hypothetical protein